MNDFNDPKYADAKKLSDFVVFVKEADSVFVKTSVLLNEKGQLLIDFDHMEDMYALCLSIQKHLMLQKWEVNNKEVFLYTSGREKRAILSPIEVLPYKLS